MKKLKALFCAAMLLGAASAFIATPIVMVTTGCKTPNRTAYNTLASVGKTVDIAEREYLDRVVTKQIGTNDFTRIQAGYAAFQDAYRAALAVSMNDSNALAPANLTALGMKLISDINQAKGTK